VIRPEDALRAAQSPPVRPLPVARLDALMVGAGGVLGSAVLEGLLARRRGGRIHVLATRALRSTADGLEPIVASSHAHFADPAPPVRSALIVFDRARHANGRDNAFLRPLPQELPALAQRLHAAGVRHLIVVLPLDPAGMPQALRAGLAGLDEHAVAALGFEHVVFVRPADAAATRTGQPLPQRLADTVLAQLRLMLPSSQQPVRTRQVAAFAAELAVLLPASAAGTRVAAPELVWQAAQSGNIRAITEAWLAGRELPPLHAPRMRM
jgi:hypothetical protein